MSRDHPTSKNSRLPKLGVLGFAGLLTAMVIFAGVAKAITLYQFEDDAARAGNWPMLAFIPAFIVAGVLGVIGWRARNWRTFAIVQSLAAAVLFAVLLAIFGPD